MRTRNLFERLVVLLVLFSLVLSGSVPALAQDLGAAQGPNYQDKAAQWRARQDNRITPADRQAAARRAAAAGLALPEIGTSTIAAMPGAGPRPAPSSTRPPVRSPPSPSPTVGRATPFPPR